jgi:hypothetical protein
MTLEPRPQRSTRRVGATAARTAYFTTVVHIPSEPQAARTSAQGSTVQLTVFVLHTGAAPPACTGKQTHGAVSQKLATMPH